MDGKIYYARYGDVCVLKFIEHILYAVSSALDEFLSKLFEKGGFQDIVIDLTEAKMIDSLNLGMLAKIAKYMQSELGKKATIISTNEDITEILESVGFDQVFQIVDDPQDYGAQLKEIPEVDDAGKDLAEMFLSAHKSLADINEANKEIFQDICSALEDEVQEK